eukprot:CAMPEP_0171451676 /NCGR_PEP_ID=MMETSP0945-20130129/85_1 /TAXON_ID=109269 /ORGANISM="Vaucheria litorea, Strain CCMP2940" /LENGTH=72 /DNA_ID=CAMNT_0011976183 /DNA_START=197 /DNA_END=415 /DNA_ORIENTATION=+
MNQWEKITFYAVPVVGVLAAYNVFAHFSHGHHDEGEPVKYDYQGFRKKAFPWSCPQCPLFDKECWKECRASK